MQDFIPWGYFKGGPSSDSPPLPYYADSENSILGIGTGGGYRLENGFPCRFLLNSIFLTYGCFHIFEVKK